jgi:hypothetical protein
MDKDQIIEDEATRDTNAFNSAVSDMGEFNAETIVILNGLDKQVGIQVQGSIDSITWLDVGPVTNVPATTNDYATVSDYFPCYRVVATAASTPTTGLLNVWIVKSK